MPCMIHNPSVEPVSLPYPFRGVLAGGARATLNLTAAQVEAVLPQRGSGLRVEVLPSTFAGPFDMQFTGGAGSNPDTSMDATGVTNQSTTAVNNNGTAVNNNAATGVTNANTTPTNQSTTATNVAEVRTGHVRYDNPIAAEVVSLVAAVALANGALALLVQPDFPRKLQVAVVDADSSISAGTADLVGIGPSGEAVTESVPLTGGTLVHTTAKAYATVTSATVANLVGATPVIDTVSIGVSSQLGLPGQKTPLGDTFAVYKADANSVNEAVGSVDANAGTIDPTTAPNGAADFNFWYTYNVTVVQAAHTHTQDAHTHTVNDPQHTHTQAAHTHTQAAHTHTVTDPTHGHNVD